MLWAITELIKTGATVKPESEAKDILTAKYLLEMLRRFLQIHSTPFIKDQTIDINL